MPQDNVPARSAPSMWDLGTDDLLRVHDAHAPLDFSSEAFRRGEAAGGIKRIARNGARFTMGEMGGSGFFDVVRLSHGIDVQVVNYVTPMMRRRRWHSLEPIIILRAALCGDERLKVERSTTVVSDRPELTLICVPKGMVVTFERQGGVRHQSVTGIFSLSALLWAFSSPASPS